MPNCEHFFFLCIIYSVNLLVVQHGFDCCGLCMGDSGFYHSLHIRKKQSLLAYLFIFGLCSLETLMKTKDHAANIVFV